MADATAGPFTLIWTTPASTFAPRYFRSIDSICKHHPFATISVLSNSLPPDFFAPLHPCAVRVERYDLEAMTRQSGRATIWYGFRRFWNRSSYFANHEADLLRLLVLQRRGGVYVDTDVVFLRPLRLADYGAACSGLLGVESGGGGRPAAHLGGATATGLPLPRTAVLCNAAMAFAPNAPLLARAIDTFVEEYVPLTPGLSMLELYARGEWGAMGPLISNGP